MDSNLLTLEPLVLATAPGDNFSAAGCGCGGNNGCGSGGCECGSACGGGDGDCDCGVEEEA